VAAGWANLAVNHVVCVKLAAAATQNVQVDKHRKFVGVHTSLSLTSAWYALNALLVPALENHARIMSVGIARQTKAKSVAAGWANLAVNHAVCATLAAAATQHVQVDKHRKMLGFYTSLSPTSAWYALNALLVPALENHARITCIGIARLTKAKNVAAVWANLAVNHVVCAMLAAAATQHVQVDKHSTLHTGLHLMNGRNMC